MFVIANRIQFGVGYILWVGVGAGVGYMLWDTLWVQVWDTCCGCRCGCRGRGVAILGQWLYWDQDVPTMIGRVWNSGTISRTVKNSGTIGRTVWNSGTIRWSLRQGTAMY